VSSSSLQKHREKFQNIFARPDFAADRQRS
jgi:hypothetical protein